MNIIEQLIKDYDFSSWSCFRNQSRKSLTYSHFLYEV